MVSLENKAQFLLQKWQKHLDNSFGQINQIEKKNLGGKMAANLFGQKII